MLTKHEQWMAQHKRTYKSNEEKSKRFKVFKDNVEFIERFNKAGKNKYKLGINEFADLTNEEFVAKCTGAKIPSFKRSSKTPFMYGNVKGVASSLDWRDKGAVTAVENQGGCGCCWAFSAVAAMEGISQIKTGKLVSLSEQQLLDCMTTTDSCKGGWMEHAFEFATQNHGLDSDTDYPYRAKEGTCSPKKPSSLPAMITGHQSVPMNNETALLMAVANQPVSVRIDPTQMRFYKSGILTGNCGTHLTHAITAVGYGTSEDGTKYWIFKNSWGPKWGENGFIRIQRDIAAKEGMCGIAMYPTFPTV
ncbi:senescence-specific cysteine protease SAG39-like [Olea europaea var. sylvestris]|uniref:senescence-specific cysteine protease SAG39-like n=1 Tax=Olea europaea var. sylvestris TaxID=158386 RepID=UPI000C1D6194|nr:senescence-specific cysteine protease SAG39-like [Olea europaea var. sylvestris]